MPRRPNTNTLIAAALLAGVWPSVAAAGMPHWMLTDVARMRVDAISFFLVTFFVASGIVRWVWNALSRDFPRMPRLTYWRATGMVALWGTLFLLVLTMISGARELLTPGAWEGDGRISRLASKADRDADERERFSKMDALKRALWQWADAHGGSFPRDQWEMGQSHEQAWESSEVSRTPYEYAGTGRTLGGADDVIAYEPAAFGRERVVLLGNGDLVKMDYHEIQARLGPSAGGRR